MNSNNWEYLFEKYNFDLNTDKKEEVSNKEEQLGKFESEHAKDNNLPVEDNKSTAELLTEESEGGLVSSDAIDNDDEEEPEPEAKPVTKEELELLSSQQAMCAEIAGSLHNKAQQLISLCSEFQQPKGISKVVRFLDDVRCVCVATRILIEHYLEKNQTEAFQTIGDSKLKRMATNSFRTIQAHEISLKEGMDDVEGLIKGEKDRHTLNLRMRIIAAQVASIHDFAKKQATTFSKAIDSHPSENAALDILKLIAEKEDKEVNTCIDYTLNLVGMSMVMTEDAPNMLEALVHNDTKSIINLQKKLIDYIFKDK